MIENYKNYIILFSCLIGGVLLGLAIEKLALKLLKNFALKTAWKGDDIIFGSFKGLIFSLIFISSGYFALQYITFSPKIISVSDKVMFSLLVLLITIYAARLLVGFVRLKASKSVGLMPSSSIMANITRIIVFILGFLIILQTLGVSITPLLTALGVGGLAVALALQDTLTNLFSGIQLIASRQIRPGDYVKLTSNEEGYVTDITWRNTTIRMLSNNLIVIPNSKVASTILTNYYLPDKETAVLVEVGVSYDSDLDKVEKATVEAAQQVMGTVQGGVKSFEPFIRYHTFDDSSIGFTVILRVQEFTDQYLVKHEFIKALHKKYKSDSIEIPFPIRTVILKEKGEQ